MSKALESFNNIIREGDFRYLSSLYCKDDLKEDIEIVEERLKALEIIINKRVDVLCFLKSKSREQYNEESCSDMYLTIEEYNFLKEVLL